MKMTDLDCSMDDEKTSEELEIETDQWEAVKLGSADDTRHAVTTFVGTTSEISLSLKVFIGGRKCPLVVDSGNVEDANVSILTARYLPNEAILKGPAIR